MPLAVPLGEEMERKHINHMGVFSEDWNSHFHPKSWRSRRQRFPQSGARRSGFSAVFCHDWRDEVAENDANSCARKRRRLGCEKAGIDDGVEHRQRSSSLLHKRPQNKLFNWGANEVSTAALTDPQPLEYESCYSGFWHPTYTDSIASSLPSLGSSICDLDHSSQSPRMPWDVGQDTPRFCQESFCDTDVKETSKQNNGVLGEETHGQAPLTMAKPAINMEGLGYDHWIDILDCNSSLGCDEDFQFDQRMSEAELDRHLEELLKS